MQKLDADKKKGNKLSIYSLDLGLTSCGEKQIYRLELDMVRYTCSYSEKIHMHEIYLSLLQNKGLPYMCILVVRRPELNLFYL